VGFRWGVGKPVMKVVRSTSPGIRARSLVSSSASTPRHTSEFAQVDSPDVPPDLYAVYWGKKVGCITAGVLARGALHRLEHPVRNVLQRDIHILAHLLRKQRFEV